MSQVTFDYYVLDTWADGNCIKVKHKAEKPRTTKSTEREDVFLNSPW